MKEGRSPQKKRSPKKLLQSANNLYLSAFIRVHCGFNKRRQVSPFTPTRTDLFYAGWAVSMNLNKLAISLANTAHPTATIFLQPMPPRRVALGRSLGFSP